MTSNTVGSSSATQVIEIVQRGPQGAAGLSDGNKGDVTVSSNGTAVAINAGVIVDADINSDAEIAVSKLADGSARQLLQTNSAGTGVEWASNIDVQGTLDVTGAATFDGSVSATTFTGALSGNSTTATTFQTARNINGVSFDGSADITITAAAGTLTGDTLKNTVVTSSLTSVGTLGSLTVTNNVSSGGITGDAVVTSGSSTSDTQVYSAKRSDELYFNKGTLEEITSGETWASNDNAVATTAALDARITDLVDDVGGFVPIANETSFPNANPDVNNGAGTIVSISDAGGVVVDGSGVSTTGRTVGGSTVTINGIASNLHSTTIAADHGMLVETTTTLNTYTFHRLVPKATEVTTVASKATEIGRLGTADAVADMNTLGTTAIVSDMDTLADISSNITTVAGISSNVTTVAGNTTNINTVAGVSSNVTSVAGSIANVNTVATNINNVNSFSDTYKVATSNPANPTAGDLYFNTATNKLNVCAADGNWHVAATMDGSGGTITGTTHFTDDTVLSFGNTFTAPDFKIWHQSADNRSYIWEGGAGALCIQGSYVKIQSPQTDPTDASEAEEDLAVFKSDGAVELYWGGDGAGKRIETTSTGGKITGKLEITDVINRGAANSSLQLSGSNASNAGANILLYGESHDSHANQLRFRQGSTDKFTVNGSGDATFAGEVTIKAPTGGHGILNIQSDNGSQNADKWEIMAAHETENRLHIGSYIDGSRETNIRCEGNKGVELNFDGTEKFRTVSTGAKTTGLLEVTGNLGVGNDSPYSNVSFNSLTIGKTKKGLIELKDENNVAKAHLYETSGDFNVSTVGSAGNIKFITGATVTALTIDQNQAATFAGDISVAGDIKVGTAAGTANQYLKKNSSNQLAWETISPGSAGGANTIHMDDNVKITFGDTTTPDLQIHHNGSWNYIRTKNSTNFVIQVEDTEGNDDNAIVAIPEQGVQAFFNGSKKFETTSDGVTVSDIFVVTETNTKNWNATSPADTTTLKLQNNTNNDNNATGIELRVQKGNGAAGMHYITNTATGTDYKSNLIFSRRTGSGASDYAQTLTLGHDGVANFAGHIQFSGTTSSLTNISQPIITRSGSSSGSYPFDGYGHLILQSRGDGTNRDIIFATGTNGANKTIFDASGNATFAGNILPSSNNTKNIGDSTTNFNTIWASSRFRGNDNVRIGLGSSEDLQIKHDGTTNLIESPTGADLHIKMMGDTMDNADQTAAEFIEDGACKFYFNGAGPKFETTSDGAKTTGILEVTGQLQANGSVKIAQKPVTQTKKDISASEIDCSTGNYFYKAITTGSSLTLTFTNLPTSGEAYGMIVELKFSGSASQTTIQWPTEVTWAEGGSAPTFTEDKTQVYSLITHDGGTKWRASHLKDYTN